MSLGTSCVICIPIYFLQISLLLFCVREWEYSLNFVVSNENTFFSLPVLLPFNCRCIFIRCRDSLEARTRTCLFCNTMGFCHKSLLRVLGILKAKRLMTLKFVKACDKCCVFSLCVFLHRWKVNTKGCSFYICLWNTDQLLRTGTSSDDGLILLDFPQFCEKKWISSDDHEVSNHTISND